MFNLLGQQKLNDWVGLFERLGAIPGWALLIVVWPLVGIRHSLALLLGLITSIVSLVWLTFTLILKPGAGVRRWAGGFQFVFSLAAWLILLLEIPLIDSVGTHANLAIHFLAIVADAHMTGWVWFAWSGLLLLAIGGLFEATGIYRNNS